MLDLPVDKPWLNDGPSFLFEMGLPDGWESRTTTRAFGGLVVHLLAREDLIVLKLWAATNARAPGRRARDLVDLRLLKPTRDELLGAARWCLAKDAAAGFFAASGMAEIFRDLNVAWGGSDDRP